MLMGHTRGVVGAQELRDGRLLSWSRDGALRLWTADGQPLQVLEDRVQDGSGEARWPIDILGSYSAHAQRITLYDARIRRAADDLGLDEEALRIAVWLHEVGHAVVHLAVGADTGPFDAAQYDSFDGGETPSALHETLAQLLCYHALRSDDALSACFFGLSKGQPAEYRHWTRFVATSLDELRWVLMRMRRQCLPLTFEAFVTALEEGQALLSLAQPTEQKAGDSPILRPQVSRYGYRNVADVLQLTFRANVSVIHSVDD